MGCLERRASEGRQPEGSPFVDHYPVGRPCHLVDHPGIDRELGHRQVHSQWVEGVAHQLDSLLVDLVARDRLAAHRQDRSDCVHAPLGPCAHSPPPSCEPSILCEFP